MEYGLRSTVLYRGMQAAAYFLGWNQYYCKLLIEKTVSYGHVQGG